ncbi:MAG: alpha/beta hydrolase [Clostridiales bacterium]|nr:alpha/beta hydrolase [Clostridiales bacterium]
METLQIADRRIVLFPAAEKGAPLVLLCGGGEEMGPFLDGAGFSLAAVEELDWNRDLSPWPAPPLRKGEKAFSGGADAFLEILAGKILPAVREALGAAQEGAYLAGYSLAGLFALYALYRTDAFDGAVSASGSLWYPGFSDFAARHAFAKKPRRVYLSLGDREKRSVHPVLRTVEDETRRLERLLRDRGVETVLEMNAGGHFQDAGARLARGVRWIAAVR